jgi:hypothetical protein
MLTVRAYGYCCENVVGLEFLRIANALYCMKPNTRVTALNYQK